MTDISYRRDIDGLRALAVVPVVLGHAGVAGFSGGFVGVDVFFVISGYLITGILAREMTAGRFSIVRFYERRARRILPALFAVLAACFAGGYLVLPPEMLEGLAKSAGAALLFASNVWFWRSTGDYFGTAAELEPLLHTWSLAVEEQFYIVFPLILGLVAARGRHAMIGLVAVLSLLSFLLSLWATPRMPEANFFLAPTRAWELGLGALLALLAGTGTGPQTSPASGAAPRGRSRLRDAAGLAGLALIIGAIVLYDPLVPFPGLAAVPPCLGTVLILWSGTAGTGPAGRILSFAPFVWIGLISYSLYLWHWPVQVLFRVLGNSAHLSASSLTASVVLATALAWISWRFVERPFRRPPPEGFGRGSIFGMSLAGGVVLGSVGLVVLLTNGLPARIPGPVLAAYQNAIEMPPLRRTCFGRSPDTDEGLCRIGAAPEGTGSATVLVWGDSHVDALLPGIDPWMSKQGLTGYVAAKSGCPPLLGLIRADRGSGHGCDIHNKAVMAFLKHQKRIDTVVLHARWAIAVEGHRPPGEPGAPFLLLSEDDLVGTVRPEDNHDRVARAIRDTVARIRADGRRVIIIDTVPEIGWSVPHALFGARYVGSDLPSAPDLAQADLRNRRFRAIVEPLLDDSKVRLVSLAPDLCTPGCRVEQDGHALYRDDDHLSVWAARTYGMRLMDKAFSNP